MVEGFADITPALRPGVYILARGHCAVFVGKAKQVYARVYAHKHHKRGSIPLPGMPTRPVEFDKVYVRTCRLEELEQTYLDTCVELKWSPT